MNWLFIVLFNIVFAMKESGECTVENEKKVDCGFPGITKHECMLKSCCWSEHKDRKVPWCYKRQPHECSGVYVTKSVEITNEKATCEIVFDSRQCPDHFLYSSIVESELTVSSSFYGEKTIRILIEPSSLQKKKEHFSVPNGILLTPVKSAFTPISTKYTGKKVTIAKDKNLHLQFGNDFFSLKITRENSLNDSILELIGDDLRVKKDLVSFSLALSTDTILYGIGERAGPLRIDPKKGPHRFTLFNIDNPPVPGMNLYGSHPFFLGIRKGKSHGVFFRNSNGMDVIVDERKITFKALAGPLDIFIFIGPSPVEVIQQYSALVGLPFMPPFWSLGFHQSRYGYSSIDEVEKVVASYQKCEIPLDTIWLDIDYMNEFENFSLDPVNYPQDHVKKFIENLHKNHQHIIPIVDPGIRIRKDSSVYQRAISEDLLIKNFAGKPLKGMVWPGPTHFPDFFHPLTDVYWRDCLLLLYKQIPYSGIWLDMNEISNFCDGECSDHSHTSDNFFPYTINNDGSESSLNTKTIDMSAVHFGGYKELNVHNLYGLMETKSTYKSLVEILPGKSRPFIISRSTFSGSGSFGGHWTGDNRSNWIDLKQSVAAILSFQLFAIPMVGADICGFSGDTCLDLCVRWMQLGSFYPFARNHNSNTSLPQESYHFKTVLETSKKYLSIRYSLLHYWYTQFHYAHQNGTPVVRPLFMEFPHDSACYDIHTQFLAGPSLLVAPVLEPEVDYIEIYLPAGQWYSFEDGWASYKCKSGRKVKQRVELNYMPVWIRGGHIVPIQRPGLRTADVHDKPFALFIAAPLSGNVSTGSLYVDDGVSLDNTQSFTECSFRAIFLKFSITISVEGSSFSFLAASLFEFQILSDSFIFSPNIVTVNSAPVKAIFSLSKHASDRWTVRLQTPIAISAGLEIKISA